MQCTIISEKCIAITKQRRPPPPQIVYIYIYIHFKKQKKTKKTKKKKTKTKKTKTKEKKNQKTNGKEDENMLRFVLDYLYNPSGPLDLGSVSNTGRPHSVPLIV